MHSTPLQYITNISYQSTDASNYAAAAVISYVQRGKEQVITYAGDFLICTEKK